MFRLRRQKRYYPKHHGRDIPCQLAYKITAVWVSSVVREVTNFGAWTDIATLPASTYPGRQPRRRRHRYRRGWRRLHRGRRWRLARRDGEHPQHLPADTPAPGAERRRQRGGARHRAAQHQKRQITRQPQLTRPTGLSLTEAGGDITADWNDVADATGYVLEWREEGSSGAWQTADVSSPPHTFTP